MTRGVERIARSVGIAALGLALILTVIGTWGQASVATRGGVPVLRVDARNADSAVGVARALAELVIREATTRTPRQWPSLFLDVTVIPSAGVRAVLGGATGAGMPVRWWDSTGVRAMALDAVWAPMPQSSTFIAAASDAAPTDRPVTFALTARDAGGVLDSVADLTVPLRIRATRLQGPVRAQLHRSGQLMVTASVPAPAAAAVRRILLLAQPGWEAKFVVAALEESGWLVDGTLAVSPTARVRLGTPTTLDTTRYSVALVLDSGVANVQALRRFLGQGGGVVISGEALRDPSLASLRPARIVDDRAVIAGALLSDAPRQGVSAYRLDADKATVVLEREGSAAMLVVARRGIGRVLASGYRSTWHWRMEGREGSAGAHRQWWNELVSTVAFAPRRAASDSLRDGTTRRWPGDAAPVADLIARIGAPSPGASRVEVPASRARFPAWILFVIAAVSLLTEWALRRLRGAP